MAIEPNTKLGYTLIELAITITLIAIIFTLVAVCLSRPLLMYASIAQRATLLDTADLVMRRMERDIHQALPNSIRVKSSNGLQALELVNVVAGMRYRAASPGPALNFNGPNNSFNVLATFPANMLAVTNYRVVVYNLGEIGASSDAPIPGANVYATATAAGPNPPAGTHVITPAATKITLTNVGNEGNVALSPGFQFAFASTQQRVYFVDTPLSYVCDPSTSRITRLYNYPINSVQPISLIAAPLTTASYDLIASNVTACNFTYQPGTSSRAGTVTIALTVANGAETVQLLQQVHVSNVP